MGEHGMSVPPNNGTLQNLARKVCSPDYANGLKIQDCFLVFRLAAPGVTFPACSILASVQVGRLHGVFGNVVITMRDVGVMVRDLPKRTSRTGLETFPMSSSWVEVLEENRELGGVV